MKKKKTWGVISDYKVIIAILAVLGISFLFNYVFFHRVPFILYYAVPYPVITLYNTPLNINACSITENITEFPEEGKFEMRTIRKGDIGVPIYLHCDGEICVQKLQKRDICKIYDYEQVRAVVESFNVV